MKMIHLRLTAFLTLISSLLWLFFMITTVAIYGSTATPEEAVGYTQTIGWLHYANYLNAALITLFATAFFAALDHFLEQSGTQTVLRRIGIIFLPAYAALNLVVYLSQVTILPSLAQSLKTASDPSILEMIIPFFMQSYPTSWIAFLNSLAYALLGIPSILFGMLLIKAAPLLKTASSFLIANGIACILSLVGCIFNLAILELGSLIGGVLFIIALIFFVITFPKIEDLSAISSINQPGVNSND